MELLSSFGIWFVQIHQYRNAGKMEDKMEIKKYCLICSFYEMNNEKDESTIIFTDNDLETVKDVSRKVKRFTELPKCDGEIDESDPDTAELIEELIRYGIEVYDDYVVRDFDITGILEINRIIKPEMLVKNEENN